MRKAKAKLREAAPFAKRDLLPSRPILGPSLWGWIFVGNIVVYLVLHKTQLKETTEGENLNLKIKLGTLTAEQV